MLKSKSTLSLEEKTMALMQERRMTYREARAELGRRGAAARANKRKRWEFGRQLMERMGLT